MDVRSRILHAALDLLAKGGAQELTQPRVCKAAGVRHSHLTYYFPTIQDLLQAVAMHTLAMLAAELGGKDARKRPRSFAAGIAAAAADKRRVRVILGLVTAADRDPLLKPPMRAFVKEIRKQVAPMLKSGHPEVGDEDVAFVHTVVVGAAVLQLARDDAEARREARRVIERALACVMRR